MKTTPDITGRPGITWEPEAVELINRVPFFVRPLARRKVADYARARGESRITVALVNAARAQFVKDSEPAAQKPSEDPADFWRLEVCRGEEAGCPFAITSLKELRNALEKILAASEWGAFLERTVTGPILHHHCLRVAACACPNACSQPQIKDIGLIAALRPTAVSQACTGCGRCVEACREGAVEVRQNRAVLHPERCVACGLCVRHCPAKALETDGLRLRFLVGGKLGRHPRFASELAPHLHMECTAPAVESVVAFIKARLRPGERVGDMVERLGKDEIAAHVRTKLCAVGA